MTTAAPAAPPRGEASGPPPVAVVRAQLLLTATVLLVFLSNFRLVRLALLVLPVAALAILLSTPTARLMRVRVPLAVLGLLTWAAASYFWSADPWSTRRDLIDLAIVAAPAVVAGALLNVEHLRIAVTRAVKIMLAITITALVVAPGWSTAPNLDDPVPGWSATFGHKNGLGFFCLYAAVALFFDRSRARWVWLTATVVLLLGSQSSTALALVVAVTGLLLWRGTTQAFLVTHQRWAYRLLSLTALVVGLAALVSRPSLATDALGKDLTLTGRTEIWGPVLRRIEEHLTLGLGWGGVWQPTSTPTLEMWREARFEAHYAHNGYLDILLQLGLVGGLLFLAILAGTIWRLGRLPPGPGPLWGLFLVTVLGVAAVTESGPFTGQTGLATILALATSVMQRGLTGERDTPQPAQPTRDKGRTLVRPDLSAAGPGSDRRRP